MPNPFIKVALALGFMFAVVGGTVLHSGYSTWNRALETDASWEKATLKQWINGKTKNRSLFEIGNFWPTDRYWAVPERRSTGFRIVYVPLVLPNQAEDEGQSIKVVVGVPNVENEKALEELFDRPTLKLQLYQTPVPPLARSLSSIYPKIDWEHVRWAMADERIPTVSDAKGWLIAGSLLILPGLLSFGVAFFLWRRQRVASRGSFGQAATRLESNRNEKTELGNSAASKWTFKVIKGLQYLIPILILFNFAIFMGQRMDLLTRDLGATILFVTVPLFFVASLVALIAQFFLRCGLEMKRVERTEIPEGVLECLDREAREFQMQGFEFVGFAHINYLGNRHAAYLLSPDRKCLAEVTVEGKNVTAIALGVTSDAFLYATGLGSTDIVIDGTKSGIPLASRISTIGTTATTLAAFDKFRKLVDSSESQLLTISPSNIFHLMHYEAILVAWWGHNSSLSFRKPESLPSLEEVTHDNASFCFRREAKLDNAFLEPNPTNLLAATNPSAVESTSNGGQPLYSARFFQMQD